MTCEYENGAHFAEMGISTDFVSQCLFYIITRILCACKEASQVRRFMKEFSEQRTEEKSAEMQFQDVEASTCH